MTAREAEREARREGGSAAPQAPLADRDGSRVVRKRERLVGVASRDRQGVQRNVVTGERFILWPGPLPYADAVSLLAGRHTAYVLGIDQARSSGLAVFDVVRRRCVMSGTVVGAQAQQEALLALGELAGFSWSSLLVVLEDHGHVPKRKNKSTRVVLGLGEARGRFRALLSVYGHPEENVIRVAPSTWRKMFGPMPRGTRRSRWKAEAMSWATMHLGYAPGSDDEAEAICIAAWGVWNGLAVWSRHRQRAIGAESRLVRRAPVRATSTLRSHQR